MTNTYNWWFSQVALVVKNLPTKAGEVRDVGSVPGSGRSPGGGHGNPLQYSCLENPMDRGAWRATVTGSQRVRHNWSMSMHVHTSDNCYHRLPRWLSGKEYFCWCRRCRFDPWIGKIPRWRTGKPGVLQSMGLQRVTYNLATEQQLSLLTWIYYSRKLFPRNLKNNNCIVYFRNIEKPQTNDRFEDSV